MQRIFAGDVQGCADELEDLVARARSAFGGEFELWLVGDLVNRGPASLRVLQRVRALEDEGRARCVLGNHELALLRAAAGTRRPRISDTFRDVLEAGGDWIDWLRRRPLAAIGTVGAQRFAMVHASVPPGWSLEKLEARVRRVEERFAASRADAFALLAARRHEDTDAETLARVTTCRSVTARGRWSSRAPTDPADAWHARWLAHDPEYGVVYGHWAVQGLHVQPLLRGLDTGCVYHGAWGHRFLTAWLPRDDAAQPFDVPDESFWHVPARARYLDDEMLADCS